MIFLFFFSPISEFVGSPRDLYALIEEVAETGENVFQKVSQLEVGKDICAPSECGKAW